MPEPRGPEGAKCKCGHSMDQHTDSMAAAPCAFWGCRCDDFDQDPAPSPPRAGEPNVRPEDTTGRLGFDCFFPGLEGTCPQCGHEHVSLMRSPKHGWLCWPCAAAEQFALGVQDAEAPSPSPAGPGEADLDRLIAGCELAGRDERHSTGKLYLDAAASLRALLARLRESRDAHEQSVLAALVQAGALRAEVARLTEALAKATEPYTDKHGTVWVVPTAFAYMRSCRALQEQHEATDRLIKQLATARAEEREADCRAVCPTCAHGFPVEFIGSNRVASHRDNDGNLVACAASAIRTREAAP